MSEQTTMNTADKGTMCAIHVLRDAIEKIDSAAGYNASLYGLRDKLIEELANLEDEYNTTDEDENE